MTQFLFGADPEIFLKRNGKPFSAFGVIEGTKESPHKVEGGAYQVDGMATEFNIDPVPNSQFETFNLNIVKAMKALAKAVKEKDPSITLNIAATQDFGEEFIEQQPDQAKELGCDPDFNAYTLEQNPTPDGKVSFRTGAGHVHVGWGSNIPVDNPDHLEICANFVKSLDATVGLFMTCIDRDSRRTQLYGKAGAMRPKPYGVEYRTPSSVWIRNRETRHIVWQLMNKAIGFTTQGINWDTVILGVDGTRGGGLEKIQKIINTNDSALAVTTLRKEIFGDSALMRSIEKLAQIEDKRNA